MLSLQAFNQHRFSCHLHACLQACVLGALSVLIVDRACRQPLIAAEPSCGTLFELSSDLEGYEDRSWAATRREAAAKAVTSLMQRDHDARSQLIMMGGINQILAQLEAKVRCLHEALLNTHHVVLFHGLFPAAPCGVWLMFFLHRLTQGPGHSKVQFCMAALLATLVLDEQAMEILQQRGEGHLVFEAALKLVGLSRGFQIKAGQQHSKRLLRMLLAVTC
jgi:hypothetical protein